MSRAGSPSPEVRKLALAKLQTSGLTEADYKTLKMDVRTATEMVALCTWFRPAPALEIPYFNADGSPMTVNRGGKEPFKRWRYLRGDSSFKAQTDTREIKYVQLPDTSIHPYFPPSVRWQPLLGDAKLPLIITEGELKAAKACQVGYPTIGVGGVWNFKSKSAGYLLLPELEAVNWCQRHVCIIYDSDFREKPDVCSALNALAEELWVHGALPHYVALSPGPDGEKVGLDDYLLACKHPKADLTDLLNRGSEPLTLAKSMWDLNKQVIYVRDPGLVYELGTGQKIAPNAFVNHAYADLSGPELVVTPSGDTSLKRTPLAERWLTWPFRSVASRLTYAPGQDQLTDTRELNTWPGWGCEPKRGDPALFLRLIDHIFTGATADERLWFLRWLAYPLQHPGTKLFTTCLIHGVDQGTGKSLVGYTLGAIYGKNFQEIKQENLEGGFTDWAENKQFILADDVTGNDSRPQAGTLKTLVTQKTMRINIKYVPAFSVPDCVNYLFTSNQPDAFFLEDKDRRSFIWEATAPPMNEEFYRCYCDALFEDKTLGPIVFDWLLRLDLGDFNPAAPALYTQAKDNMISDTKSDLGAWVSQLKADPDMVLRVGKVKVAGDLFTTAELLRIYNPIESKVTANGLGRELRRSGVPMFNKGKTVRSTKGMNRYFIVRNTEKWLRASHAAGAKYLNTH
jgi:hypothetical protein